MATDRTLVVMKYKKSTKHTRVYEAEPRTVGEGALAAPHLYISKYSVPPEPPHSITVLLEW